jgi:ADP-heptose:LPS heptosyltransferase
LNRIGDALVTTPLLYELKRKLDCRLTILASRYNYFIFDNPLLTDEIIIFKKKVKRISKLIKLINEKKYDVIIDLHDDVSTTVSYLIAFSTCKYKIGLQKGTNKLYTNLVVKLDPARHHIIERVMEFTKPFNISYNPLKINIIYTPKPESTQIVDAYINKHFLRKDFLLGINISAGSESRFWGVKKYREIISSLNNYGINIILLCLERDLKFAWEIAGREIPIFYRNNFDEFASMISRLNFLITPDTSIVHIASAFRIPLFGLYVKYNTNDVVWYPYKSDYEVIITNEPTLQNIDTNLVKEKLTPFFEKYFYEYKSKAT